MHPQDMRTDYPGKPLLESEVDPNPFAQFQTWFDSAAEVDPEFANAMTLSTIAADGRPASRVVLLKSIEAGSFVFFTNYESAKGEELARDPRAALCFFWPLLLRQVRIEGSCEKVDRAVSEDYFRGRPRGSQIGALASNQSGVLTGRAELEQRAAALEKQYAGQPVPMPEHWGGFRLTPVSFEFWQGRLSRLHDRLRYTPRAGGWKIERLAP